MKPREIVLSGIYILFSLLGLFLIKAGGLETAGELRLFGIPINGKTIVGIFCYGTSFLLYISVITKLQISIILPVLGAINACLTVIVGILVFSERLTLMQGIGIVVIIAGTLLVGIG